VPYGVPVTRTAFLAFAVDAAMLLLFAAIGRRSHDEDGGVAGVLLVAAPFLAGWAVGAVVMRLPRYPLCVRRALPAWTIAVPLGFALRAATGRGLSLGFLIVTVLFTAATLLGWRLAAAAVRRRRLVRT
jgi:hypothetical protein